MEEPVVAGVATDKGQAKITVIGIPDVPGKAAELFKVVAEADSNIDMIVQNTPTGSDVTDRVSDISFTLPLADLGRVAGALDAAKPTLGFRELEQDADIGKLSVVGAGMRTHSGVSATLFAALAKASINRDDFHFGDSYLGGYQQQAAGRRSPRSAHRLWSGCRHRSRGLRRNWSLSRRHAG